MVYASMCYRHRPRHQAESITTGRESWSWFWTEQWLAHALEAGQSRFVPKISRRINVSRSQFCQRMGDKRFATTFSWIWSKRCLELWWNGTFLQSHAVWIFAICRRRTVKWDKSSQRQTHDASVHKLSQVTRNGELIAIPSPKTNYLGTW